MYIIEPTLILDSAKCRKNIRSMLKKAAESEVSFRPHFKTHNSREIGRWFREEGVDKITVSSVKMAGYFADDGWNDITIALTFNILEIEKVKELLKTGKKINLTIDSPEIVETIKKNLNFEVSVFIKVDTGYNRTGILSDDIKKIEQTISVIKKNGLKFAGFLTHSGHSYRAESKEDILDIYNDTVKKMDELKQIFIAGDPDLVISIGDTPTISIAGSLTGVDEIRPGNFVFYDLMQLALGSCVFDQIAVVFGTPVISKSFSRKEVVVYGGAVHLSKEFLPYGTGRRNYGQPVLLKPDGWGKLSEGSYISSASQEHSVIHADDKFFHSVSIGDVVGIVPVHSCLAANLAGSYLTLEGVRIPKNRS